MGTNPVLREGIQIYLLEGHGLAAYFYLLLILAPIQFLTLFLPSLDPQMWVGPANLFKASSIVALVLILYFGLRIANQEFVPWRFVPVKRWLHREGVSPAEVAVAQLSLLSLHMLLFVFLSSPLIIWAGAIARAPAGSILIIFLLLLFYSLTYGVWGLVALVLWEHRLESRQVFVRCFFLAFVFLSALLYLPLSPIAFLLSYLARRESAWAAHFVFHLFLLGSGLLVYRWALRREAYS